MLKALARAPIPLRRIDHSGAKQRSIHPRRLGRRPDTALAQLEYQPSRTPLRANTPQVQQQRRDLGAHLTRTRHRPMRPILKPVQASGPIARQSRMQRLLDTPTFSATCQLSLITA